MSDFQFFNQTNEGYKPFVGESIWFRFSVPAIPVNRLEDRLVTEVIAELMDWSGLADRMIEDMIINANPFPVPLDPLAPHKADPTEEELLKAKVTLACIRLLGCDDRPFGERE